MNKKVAIVIVSILILVVLVFLVLKPDAKSTDSNATLNKSKNEPTFLVDGYPIDKVPLYKLGKVSSSKIFVNTDPKNKSEFDETKFAYYNVVFESSASKDDFLNYYKNLFESPITDEYPNSNMVKGKIGQYKVSAAHYNSDDIGYIQVHLPDYSDDNLDKFYLDFPKVVEPNSSIVEHEKSYGLLNQVGGQTEYTKYFTVIDSGDKNNDGQDDVDEFSVLEAEYKNQLSNKPGYIYNEKGGTIKWQDGKYDSILSISRDHGRIYLMMRKSINQ